MIENPPAELRALIERIDAALDAERAMPGRILDALCKVTAQTSWLPPDRRRADHANYARHILWCDPRDRFSVLSIVWNPGQKSPIHAHRTWCAVGVYEGILTEETYRESNALEACSLARRGAGSVNFDPGSGAHRIANYGAGPAISIHVYGVGASLVSSGINRLIRR
jgi:predicted metal-dependent enzyme (double-stranded beta helix superfamily)